jgi:myo-inositol-1(or 4)-monophosphatase
MPIPSPIAPRALLAVAVESAWKAGHHALRHIRRRRQTIQVTRHDVKLKLDVECQAIAERSILGAFPDHAILGEETAGSTIPDHSPYVWIIDPIDGTVNFSHGLPFWCCSIAIQFKGRTLAGAVLAPALGELFTASTDTPAMRNGKRIRVSDTNHLSSALIMTGLDQKLTPRTKRLSIFRSIADNTQKARVMGAAALDICRVAAGQADGYFEAGIYTWDVTAAGLVVERAGGRTEILASPAPHRYLFMASNGRIHQPLKQLITQPAHLQTS